MAWARKKFGFAAELDDERTPARELVRVVRRAEEMLTRQYFAMKLTRTTTGTDAFAAVGQKRRLAHRLTAAMGKWASGGRRGCTLERWRRDSMGRSPRSAFLRRAARAV
jgi:hypothetical protein